MGCVVGCVVGSVAMAPKSNSRLLEKGAEGPCLPGRATANIPEMEGTHNPTEAALRVVGPRSNALIVQA